MPTDPLPQLRKLCLALPEATEKEAWGQPTFRVRNKMFAMYSQNHHGDGIIAVHCKAEPGVQDMLIQTDPTRFYKPPYVGPSGWIGVRLDTAVDWDELQDFLEDSYRLVAPRKLAALLDPSAP